MGTDAQISQVNQDTLTSALRYAERGVPVLPLHHMVDGKCSCDHDICGGTAKHPRTSNGVKDATTDGETIRGWWDRWPQANVAIATGPAAGIVLDGDRRHGGDETLAAIEAEQGTLPSTVEAATGNGRHFFFAHPRGKITNRTDIRPGLDIRGYGGYVVAPPSLHHSGRQYAWRAGHSGNVPSAPIPAWLLTLLVAPVNGETNGSSPKLAASNGRQQLLAQATRYIAGVPGAAEGGRNTVTFSAAGHLTSFCTCTGDKLTAAEILDLVRTLNLKHAPQLIENELRKAVTSIMVNGTPRAEHIVGAPRVAWIATNRHAGATPPNNGQIYKEDDAESRVLTPYSPAQSAEMDLSTDFLINGVLVHRQPGLIAGVFVTLKSSIATATPFLASFNVKIRTCGKQSP